MELKHFLILLFGILLLSSSVYGFSDRQENNCSTTEGRYNNYNSSGTPATQSVSYTYSIGEVLSNANGTFTTQFINWRDITHGGSGPQTYLTNVVNGATKIVQMYRSGGGFFTIPSGTKWFAPTLDSDMNITVEIDFTANDVDFYVHHANSSWHNFTDTFSSDEDYQYIYFLLDGSFSFDELYIWEGIPCPIPPDTNSPIIDESTLNFTSGINEGNRTIHRTNKSYYAITRDSTPTDTFTVDESSNCSVGTADENYSTMLTSGNGNPCATNESTTMSCTLNTANVLSEGDNTRYYACVDELGNENAIAQIALNMEYVVPTLSLNSLEANRSYEYGTTALIETNYDFINIYDDTGRWRNQVSPFNYTIDLLRNIRFNDSNTTQFLASEGSVFVSIDNRTDIDRFRFNLTNNGTISENISIDVNEDDVYEDILLGSLDGNNLLMDYFYSDSAKHSKINLTRNTAGIKTIYMNISTSGFETNQVENFSFRLDGFNLDVGNFLDFHEFYNNTDNVESTTAETYWMWDDFIRNITSYWTRDSLGDATFYGAFAGFRKTESTSRSSCTGGGCTNFDTDWAYEKTINFDAEESIRVQFSAYCNLPTTTTGSLACGAPPETDSMSTETGGGCIYYLSGTSDEIIDTYSASGASPLTDNSTYELIKKNDSLGIWDVYDDGVYERSITIAEEDVELKFRVESDSTSISGALCTGESQTSGTITTEMQVYHINTTGVALSWDGSEYDNSSLKTLTSKVIYEAPNDIERVYLEAEELKPTGTDITYEVSNNNGTNWQVAISTTFTAFTTSANNLSYRVNLTSDNSSETPRVRNLKLEVVPTAVTNISVDVGSDGIADWNFAEVLNSTNSPQYFTENGTEVQDYITRNCINNETCFIPIAISFGTAGTIQFSEFNLTHNPNPINITPSLVEPFNLINLSFSTGNFELDDLRVEFKGSKNITVSATDDGTAEFNRTLSVFYSNFNIALPTNVTYWEFFPTSKDSVNVTPYSQTSTKPIWNYTVSAYEKQVDAYIMLNESLDSCLQLTFSNDSITSNSTDVLINTTAQGIYSNLSANTGSFGMWNSLNLYNCSSRFYLPWISFFGICSECVRTADWETEVFEILG